MLRNIQSEKKSSIHYIHIISTDTNHITSDQNTLLNSTTKSKCQTALDLGLAVRKNTRKIAKFNVLIPQYKKLYNHNEDVVGQVGCVVQW